MKKKWILGSAFFLLVLLFSYINTAMRDNRRLMDFFASQGADSFGEYIGGLLFDLLLIALVLFAVLAVWKRCKNRKIG